MSLTSQIRDKNSPVRQFFTKFEKKDGAKHCLALLQSAVPIPQMSFTSSLNVVPMLIGTTTDYLIRYVANGNALRFESIVATRALLEARLRGEPNVAIHLENLLKIGKQNLDGRNACDYQAIYSATALAVMDNYFRSGHMPASFSEVSQAAQREAIKRHYGKNLDEKATNYLFSEYIAKLGGDEYIKDISELIKLFVKGSVDSASELFGAKIVVFNQSLGNSWLVGGADFDCIIASKKRLILTDIKTKTKPLTMEDLRQIIGYALLYDGDKDIFKFTHIGIYHSRSGSFRSLPVESVLEMTLADFKSVGSARKAFIAAIGEAKRPSYSPR